MASRVLPGYFSLWTGASILNTYVCLGVGWDGSGDMPCFKDHGLEQASKLL